MSTWLHFGYQNQAKSIKNPISKGIEKMIGLCIEVESSLGPILAAKTGLRGRQDGQDGSKRPPRRAKRRPTRLPRRLKKTYRSPPFAVLDAKSPQEAAKSPQEPPGTPPRGIFGEFLINFGSIFDRFFGQFLIDVLR